MSCIGTTDLRLFIGMIHCMIIGIIINEDNRTLFITHVYHNVHEYYTRYSYHLVYTQDGIQWQIAVWYNFLKQQRHQKASLRSKQLAAAQNVKDSADGKLTLKSKIVDQY